MKGYNQYIMNVFLLLYTYVRKELLHYRFEWITVNKGG